MLRTLIRLVLAPFLGAALITTLFTQPLPVAWACECVGDAFWVVDDVTVQGADAPWPKDGHLYPDRLSLWAQGFKFDLEYTP